MITLKGLLTPGEVAHLTACLASETFVDGGETADGQAKAVKHNLQLPRGGEAERELDRLVRAAFDRHDAFRAAAMPLHMLPMRFARYETGMTYGWHVDAAIMPGPNGLPLRSDLACTLFLTPPGSYGGGELAIQTPVGTLQTKLPAGDAVVYPATSVHRVEPVTHGVRQVALTWIQSMVASEDQRQLLIDLQRWIGELARRNPDAPELARLSGVRHNLLRMWSHG